MAYANSYLESEALGATRVELVRMLYRSAIDATAQARRCVETAQIRERSRLITKVWEILTELTVSLDKQGGELSRALSELYAYMQNRLIEANANQTAEPLVEVERLLKTLLDAWNQLPNVELSA